MAIVNIPIDPPLVRSTAMVAGQPVRASQWRPLERMAQHIAGRRRCVHPACLGSDDIEGGITVYLDPSAHSIEHEVYVWASFTGTEPCECEVTFASAAGDSVTKAWIQGIEPVIIDTMLEVGTLLPNEMPASHSISITASTDNEGTASITAWGLVSIPISVYDTDPPEE